MGAMREPVARPRMPHNEPQSRAQLAKSGLPSGVVVSAYTAANATTLHSSLLESELKGNALGTVRQERAPRKRISSQLAMSMMRQVRELGEKPLTLSSPISRAVAA